MRRSTIRCVLPIATAILVPAAAFAGAPGPEFEIESSTIDGGGGSSSGGGFEVSGTVGQPDAGAQSGGEFGLQGGHWAGVSVVQTPGAPVLTATHDGTTNTVRVSWTLPDDGFVLRQSPTLGQAPTPWTDVPLPTIQTDGTTKWVDVPNPSGASYFALFPTAP